MLFELVDTLQKKRRLLLVAAFVAADFWLLIICSQTLHAHRSDIATRIHDAETAQAAQIYQSGVADALSTGIDHLSNTIEVSALRAVVAATDGVLRAENNLVTAGKVTLHVTGVVMISTLHIAGRAAVFAGHALAFPFVATGHSISYAVQGVSGAVNNQVVSVIQPKQNTVIPVITPEQAQQATLIQSGTLDFAPTKPVGTGGACDSGAGNGGYPMPWCDAPMDSVQTVSYSSDHINRECTSYAYWYFTVVEGHADFHVTGNAKRWASTSNYPVHRLPAVDAIAVETAGAYGHVAIVQALPGQIFQGKAVPTGYILVSEMNYDWHGYFRYSYSPLDKFSAYLY